jgi:hypothetical protein
VFLQGSYGNDTNIYAESDVDIVIRLDDCFHSDLESLSDDEKSAYKQAFSDATYTHMPTSSGTCCRCLNGNTARR